MEKHWNKNVRFNIIVLLTVLIFAGADMLSAGNVPKNRIAEKADGPENITKKENKNKDEKETEKVSEEDIKKILKKLKITPVVQAPTSKSNSDYDNRSQVIKCRVNIVNESTDDIKGWGLDLYIIGKSVNSSKEYRLLKIATSSDISVEKRGKYTSEEQTCRFEYDSNNYAKFGHKYEGYLLALKDSSGAVIMKKGIPSKFEKIADKIIQLEENSIFDDKGTFIENYGRFSRFGRR
ncbi:MAG: hypothetical protein A2017_04475 [Lentisphaerae bacterium GWF2_44_16]|nr:MAG: hypothetical protein A2017_04475 [Lentisphaerae bacterium GWF2_44_16]